MFGGVAKIQIANTPNELVEMDFADYGYFANFLRIQGAFSRFSVIIFTGAETTEEQTAEMVRCDVISNWFLVYGAPGIIVSDKDSRFTGDFSRILHRPQYCCANSNSGQSPKFRGN